MLLLLLVAGASGITSIIIGPLLPEEGDAGVLVGIEPLAGAYEVC